MVRSPDGHRLCLGNWSLPKLDQLSQLSRHPTRRKRSNLETDEVSEDLLGGALRDGHEKFPLLCRRGGIVRPYGHETVVVFVNHGRRPVLDTLILLARGAARAMTVDGKLNRDLVLL